jgi:hypothetical protein
MVASFELLASFSGSNYLAYAFPVLGCFQFLKVDLLACQTVEG